VRFVTRHLSYANVIATLALILSLSGGAYAALTLPAGSVGPTQLRPRAVGERALAVPLGARSVFDDSLHEFTNPLKVCGPPTGGGPAAPCPPPLPRPLTSERITTRANGLLVITALAGMADVGGPSDDSALVNLNVRVDGQQIGGQSTVSVPQAASGVEVPYQSAVRVPSGRHTITLTIVATNFAGTLRVSPVSLSAISLPVAP
jgi:hypothetical protein